MLYLLFLCPFHPKIQQQGNENDEDGRQLEDVMLGFGPKLLKEIDASQYLNGRPKDDNCGDGHADIGSPRGQIQLALEHENRANKAT
jgi:hypothetical protein